MLSPNRKKVKKMSEWKLADWLGLFILVGGAVLTVIKKK